jgi:membrane protein DedA with SNARE-associated domain
VFFGRFVTGLRNVTGLFAGASGMPFPRFAGYAAAAAVVWALTAGLEYYWFGHALVSAPTWLQAVLVLVGLSVTILSLRLLGRRASRRLGLGAAPRPGP